MAGHFAAALILLSMMAAPATAAERSASARENLQRIAAWNAFADSLYKLHLYRLKGRQIRSTEETGGYGGFLGKSDYYRDVEYYDAVSGRILSRIQWETEYPYAIHVIQVFIYDQSNRLVKDYIAAYLPRFRNAPIQTLINFHHVDDDLHAFRQFDASGDRIYEQCKGTHFGADVNISLEEHEFPAFTGALGDETLAEAYVACFGELPVDPGKHLDPRSEAPELADTSKMTDIDTRPDYDQVTGEIEFHTSIISATPSDPKPYVKRGEAYFLLHEFDKAVADFTKAIKLDNQIDDAYFGRGMARGRQGLFDEGIADLTVYIERNPDSSLAYTKRGIRYLWKGDSESAARDMTKAVALDPNNAEAHDDLGVIHARRDEHETAIEHFLASIRIDPIYQKAYHNLAMVYYMNGQIQRALNVVDDSLRLRPDDRDSLLLKSEILSTLGRRDEAVAVKEEAEFLPQGNWSERLPVQ
jgi:tetratricopeptide (TPR) repeat protein